MNRRPAWLACIVLAATFLSASAMAGTVIVYPPQGIAVAVLASSPGDTILIAPGTYGPESGGVINHPLTVRGIGGFESNEIGICFDECASFLFRIEPGVQGVVIEDLTMTTFVYHPPRAPARAILAVSGSATIQRCSFHDLAMGVESLWGTITLRDCKFFTDVDENGVGVKMWGASGTITSNTFVATTSSVVLVEGAQPVVSRNIIAHSQGRGVLCFTGGVAQLECNDVFGNAGGNYFGCQDPTGTDGNISMDPLFCDLSVHDFRLQPQSPCLPENSPPGCGLIGALGPCDLAAGVPDVASALMQLKVTPNPVRLSAEISFSNHLSAPLLEIFDPQGRLVDVARPSISPFTWKPNRSPGPGVYFVRLRSAEGSSTVKFVLLSR